VREATEQSPCELPDHTDQASRLHGRSLLYERAVITHPVGSAESASCITAHTAAGQGLCDFYMPDVPAFAAGLAAGVFFLKLA
jgi:hypothetical protein